MLAKLDQGIDYLSNLFTFSKKKEKEREVRMSVLGLDSAGKTTILKSLSQEEI